MTYDEVLAAYEQIVNDWADQTVKGKANKYTSLNGNMFSFLTKDATLCLRLDKDSEVAFNSEFGTDPVMQHGSVMKGYVAVPDAVLGQVTLKKWTDLCWKNAQDLKPKPTKKPK